MRPDDVEPPHVRIAETDHSVLLRDNEHVRRFSNRHEERAHGRLVPEQMFEF
ncbi:MAG TPA: hypothetical protein VK148_10345 [Xanthobacteraceae bacterium]|nr:hypothetical protein [Xanthobacteraceae bacterium]